MRQMTYIASVAILLLAARAWSAESVTLAWDPSTDPEVTGAIVYYGNASRNYPWHTNVGNVTRATVQGLTNGLTYFFAVTATNPAGLESDYSNEVSTSIPARPPSPRNLIITTSIQSAESPMGPWTNLVETTLPVAPDLAGQRFYRAKVEMK